MLFTTVCFIPVAVLGTIEIMGMLALRSLSDWVVSYMAVWFTSDSR